MGPPITEKIENKLSMWKKVMFIIGNQDDPQQVHYVQLASLLYVIIQNASGFDWKTGLHFFMGGVG